MVDRKNRKQRLRALGESLQTMFRDLSARPTPDRITSVVDQLEGGDAQPDADETGLRSKLN